MKKCVDEFNAAATAASQGSQLYNLARSRQLSTRITLLGLGNLAAALLDAADTRCSSASARAASTIARCCATD